MVLVGNSIWFFVVNPFTHDDCSQAEWLESDEFFQSLVKVTCNNLHSVCNELPVGLGARGASFN